MSGTLLSQLDREIDAIEGERAEVRAELDRAREAAREANRTLDRKLKQLRKARGIISGAGNPQKAGKNAKDRVAAFVKDHGPASQAEITRQTGIGSGHVSYAIKALEADGVLTDTGQRVGRSRVVAIAGQTE